MLALSSTMSVCVCLFKQTCNYLFIYYIDRDTENAQSSQPRNVPNTGK